MNIEQKINTEFFKTISLEVAITLRGSISKADITKVWKKLNPKRKAKAEVEETPEATD